MAQDEKRMQCETVCSRVADEEEGEATAATVHGVENRCPGGVSGHCERMSRSYNNDDDEVEVRGSCSHHQDRSATIARGISHALLCCR